MEDASNAKGGQTTNTRTYRSAAAEHRTLVSTGLKRTKCTLSAPQLNECSGSARDRSQMSTTVLDDANSVVLRW